MNIRPYRQVLAPVPHDDPRPEAYSAAVLSAVVKSRLKELMGWLQFRAPQITEDVALETVAESIVEGCGDAFRAGVLLRSELNWPVDAGLVLIIHEMTCAIPVALRFEQRVWAVRTGVRFPGEETDLVVWYDDQGRRYSGVIKAVDKTTCTATVQVKVGIIDSSSPVRVMAEWVTENRSRLIHRDFTPYVPDAIEAEQSS